MRTTLNIDDDIYRQVRIRAAEEGSTVTSLVEQALIELLQQPRRARAPFRIRPLRPGWDPVPGVDPHDNSALLDIVEEGLPLEKRR